jgi:hypothetical protein
MQTLQDSVCKLRYRNVVKGIVRKTSVPRMTDIPTIAPFNILPEALPEELNHSPSQSQSQPPTSQPSTSKHQGHSLLPLQGKFGVFQQSLSNFGFHKLLVRSRSATTKIRNFSKLAKK